MKFWNTPNCRAGRHFTSTSFGAGNMTGGRTDVLLRTHYNTNDLKQQERQSNEKTSRIR